MLAPINIVEQFLVKKQMVQTEHAPFSPDFNPPDFFLFPRFKLVLKGKRFDEISDIQRNVKWLLNPKEKTSCTVSRTCIADLSPCIVIGGDNFEGD
ncbi:histone-lysine N-methyltransferase SETMAR [Trichonephila clavipes]|nr:histone-lysine N-methyltransferase SETMAR [Trichonephila clavipes]